MHKLRHERYWQDRNLIFVWTVLFRCHSQQRRMARGFHGFHAASHPVYKLPETACLSAAGK
ncbi:hypothetical protein [Chromobacterium piscinae]|uniref:hypothetical protein n=1 Tax=Chromobacterium piscinae TaxID=686831 RepID=UPI003F813886